MYNEIVRSNFTSVTAPLTDLSLERYFDRCFNDVISETKLYPAWACMDCGEQNAPAIGLGLKPDRCPNCTAERVYEIATFQARGPVVGKVFQTAFQYLLRENFGVELAETTEDQTTHNLQASPAIAIETKGSPLTVELPGGQTLNLPRAGMLRSDTRKKVYSNAQQFKSAMSEGSFIVVTNALPTTNRWYRSNDVDRFYEVTKLTQLNSFVDEISRLQTD